MDQDREQLQSTYRTCGTGLGLIGFALALLSVDAALKALLYVEALRTFRMPEWVVLLQSTFWEWAVDAPITWLALLGSYLLWALWQHPGWQRRAGLLVVLNFVDVVFWASKYAEPLGFGEKYLGHQWLVINAAAALAWAELALTASLAADVWAHLGFPPAVEIGRSIRGLIASSTTVWFLVFLQRTDWHGGWPLGPARETLPVLFMFTGVLIVRTIADIRVSLISISAARECFRAVRELEQESRANDPLLSRSEAEAELFAGRA